MECYNITFIVARESPPPVSRSSRSSIVTLESHGEHHFFPIPGNVHVEHLPAEPVLGISRFARLVEGFAKRMESQQTLKPHGFFVILRRRVSE